LGLIKNGVAFESNKEALDTFAAMIPNISEQGYIYQTSALAGKLNEETRTRLAQAIVGELTLDEAIKAIQKLADDLCAETPAQCAPIK
jgi:predicted ArsR family transcriptional regulator